MMENMTQQNRKYFDEITIARGIGILLVVLGHALKQTGVTNTAVDVLIEVIYSFHMPLFFVLSGFVSVKILQYTKAEDYIRYIKSRMLRLLLPYFVMGILYMPLKYFLSRFARNPYDFSAAWKLVIGINPNTTMWFLYTLFWVSVTALFFVKRRVLLPMLALSFILSAAAFSFDWGIRTPKYLFFFILGLCIREHYEEFLHWKEKKWCVALAAALFLGCNAALYGGFSAAEFITSVTGSILCIILSLWFGTFTGGLAAGLKTLGESSMDIYILSDPVQTVLRLLLWNILHIPNILVVILCFLLGVAGSFVSARYILRRFWIFRLLLFGEK